ncbi:HAD-IIIA family hydrolase [Mariprofundus erugo]|uniref:HAD-IIIA family hydrolase n=1 Tax=Mariprofundus erugo TaxID=2528639 RepID=A0A5R9GKM4_9PROT|nr:HAD-IA family hydrolase [Mariprofundus erugo]TLS65725.1 HAD-IIIA family hydrolase [Mariprofundus erugo]
MSGCASLILFDCDGTLTDSQGLITQAMQQAFVTCGLPEPESQAIQNITGLSLLRAVACLSDDVALHASICDAYRDHYRMLEHQVTLYPEVRETLDELRRRGYWMGVVTGKSRSGLQRVIETFELADYFMVLRTADCTHSKPHPAMVLECMDEMGVLPAHTTVVGDAVFDMQMARAAGVRAIGVSFGASSEEGLLHSGADGVVHAFARLLEYFPPLSAG